MSSITLKDGRKGAISIGIHSGELMCGVVGDTKPQFSILGTNVDKAAQIASLAVENSIMISFQTYKATLNRGKNFNFEEKTVTLGGKTQTAFVVQKQRGLSQKVLRNVKKKIEGKEQNDVNKGKNLFTTQKDEQEQSDDEKDNKEHVLSNEDNESGQSSAKGSIASTERRIDENESNKGDGSFNGSLEDDGFNLYNFTEMKDDRTIVKIAALNDKYKLVERPRLLLNFNLVTWESKFATSVFQKNFQTEICTYFTKGIIDLLLSEAIVYAIYKGYRYDIYIYVAIGVVILKVIDTMVLFFRKVKKPRGILY